MKFGHVTGNKREKHGQPNFYEPAAIRIARWEAKVAAEKAKQAAK